MIIRVAAALFGLAVVSGGLAVAGLYASRAPDASATPPETVAALQPVAPVRVEPVAQAPAEPAPIPAEAQASASAAPARTEAPPPAALNVAEASGGRSEAAPALADVSPPKIVATSTCRDAAWPYAERACAEPVTRAPVAEEPARRVRVIAIDRPSVSTEPVLGRQQPVLASPMRDNVPDRQIAAAAPVDVMPPPRPIEIAAAPVIAGLAPTPDELKPVAVQAADVIPPPRPIELAAAPVIVSLAQPPADLKPVALQPADPLSAPRPIEIAAAPTIAGLASPPAELKPVAVQARVPLPIPVVRPVQLLPAPVVPEAAAVLREAANAERAVASVVTPQAERSADLASVTEKASEASAVQAPPTVTAWANPPASEVPPASVGAEIRTPSLDASAPGQSVAPVRAPRAEAPRPAPARQAAPLRARAPVAQLAEAPVTRRAADDARRFARPTRAERLAASEARRPEPVRAVPVDRGRRPDYATRTEMVQLPDGRRYIVQSRPRLVERRRYQYEDDAWLPRGYVGPRERYRLDPVIGWMNGY